MLKKLINNYAFEKFKHLEVSDTPNFLVYLKYMLRKLVNNYALEKSKHLELSDSFLEHSQIFSDSI